MEDEEACWGPPLPESQTTFLSWNEVGFYPTDILFGIPQYLELAWRANGDPLFPPNELRIASAIENASHRPDVFIQISGINHYGLRGEDVADESTPPGDDYLAQLTVAWEDATKSVEIVGVRHVVCRTSVVLARDAILMWLMALPVRLFIGGPFGSGKQAVPWIHIDDQIGAIRFLMEQPDARGAYNLIAPQTTSNAEFMHTLTKVLRRPYWFPVPAFLMRIALGEMSVLVTEGRFSMPARLLDEGYTFKFPELKGALENIFNK